MFSHQLDHAGADTLVFFREHPRVGQDVPVEELVGVVVVVDAKVGLEQVQAQFAAPGLRKGDLIFFKTYFVINR